MLTPNVPVYGNVIDQYYLNGVDQTQGTVDEFGNNGDPAATTGSNGVLVVNNAEAPAYWNLYYYEPWNCGYNTNTQTPPVYQGPVYYEGVNWTQYEATGLVSNYYPSHTLVALECVHYGGLLYASSRFAIVGNLPNTLTLGSAVPLSSQFGMPLLYVYDQTGTVVSTLTATTIDSSGMQATFPFPSALSQSGYALAMVNRTGAGAGLMPAGDNVLSVATSQTIAGNPFGVAAQVSTTTWQSASNPDPYGDGTCAGQWTYDSNTSTNAVPVVTLYSLSTVKNGGATIPVGPNPTAIALYDSQDNEVDRNSDPCNSYQSDTTQMTRAIVTNSGSDTVSVLDIVNNAVLATITVGNQPVALAVSSDGATAYVANYADSTVTQVNLNTNTKTATVAAGGQPTSVALTAAGTLWVGGVGFLTQFNAQNMSVVATQSTGGKTISGLGYTDANNELVATTMDTSGNVYIDEVSPSTVRTGTTYAAVASHQVSSLGTYFNPRTQAMVRGFTGTLSQSSVPVNTDQAGAPPLVVQDGWAVVTATPTGFTITDTSGHAVLISETTPSPIAAIAVDANLNTVYLTMPDSNTLLTIPLPGIH
jgi:YVTN family beta-propeller protein